MTQIAPDIMGQLDAIPIRPRVPMLVVDADEVLVIFAEHLDRWFRTIGWSLDLSEYRLDGAIIELATGRAAEREEGWGLINNFFRAQTRHQAAVDGAADGLRAVSGFAQIVILTNVPAFARTDRIANLSGLGMDYPLIANTGGKGRLLAELHQRTEAPVAFVDDSPIQIESAAKHAEAVHRIHFVGSEMVKRVAPKVEVAHKTPHDWPDLVSHVREHFAQAASD